MRIFYFFILLFLTNSLYAQGRGPLLSDANSIAETLIVGGGVGGLTTLFELQKKGKSATLYEASADIGGRMLTERNWGDPTVIAERGAELVNTTDTALINLMNELGVKLSPRPSVAAAQEATYFFENRRWTHSEMQRELFKRNEFVLVRLERLAKFSDKDNLKNQTVDQFLKRLGAEPLLYNFLTSLLSSELGRKPQELSASLIFDYLAIHSKERKIDVFPDADEAHRIEGGTDTIIQRLRERVHFFGGRSNIETQHMLRSLTQNKDGIFLLSFRTPQGLKTLRAKNVILALPFFAMKQISIDIPGLNMAKLKTAQDAGHSTNTKILLRFDGRPWTQYGFSGSGLSERGYQFWDTTENQKTNSGILTVYTGEVPESEVERQKHLDEVSAEIEKMFPGTIKKLREVKYAEWHFSYSAAPKPRERMTSEIAKELSVEGLFWVGEDKSLQSQGYMNGAVETAMAVATKIIGAEKSAVTWGLAPKPGPSCRSLFQ